MRIKHSSRFVALMVMGSIMLCGGQLSAQESSSEDGSRPLLTRDKKREALARQGDHVTDKKGRTFRVSFPIYERFFLEGQTGALPASVGTSTRSPAMAGGRIAFAKSFALDFSDEDIWWVMRHRLLDTSYSRKSQGNASLRSTLVTGQYLRHDLSSFVIVPAANDLRLPANFDIATDYQLLDIELSESKADSERSWSVDQINVAHLAILMDFIRDEDYRHRFAVGVAGLYQIRPDAQNAWQHEISPLTSAKVLYGWDQADGRARVYTEATCGRSLQFIPSQPSQAQTWRWRCQTLTELEWTFLAISDRPLSIPLELRTDLPMASLKESSITATIGLRLSFSRR